MTWQWWCKVDSWNWVGPTLWSMVCQSDKCKRHCFLWADLFRFFLKLLFKNSTKTIWPTIKERIKKESFAWMKTSRKMSLRTRFIVLLPWDGLTYLVWSTGEGNRCRKAHILLAPSSSSPNIPQNWTKFPPTLSGVRRVHMMIEYKSAEVSLSQARDSPPKLLTYTPGFEWTFRIQLQPSWKSGRSPGYIDIDADIQICRYMDTHRERKREGGRERCCITRPWQSLLSLLQGIRKGRFSEY